MTVGALSAPQQQRNSGDAPTGEGKTDRPPNDFRNEKQTAARMQCPADEEIELPDSQNQRFTRRQAIAAGAVGAASAFAAFAIPSFAWDDRPYGPFRMGIQSYSLRGYDFETALKMTQRESLYYWEAFQAHVPLLDSRAKIADVLAKAKAHQIRILAWGVESFDGNTEHSRRAFDFARMMGLETISADPSPDSFGTLDKLVAEYKINIAIHNHGPGARYSTISQVLAAVNGHHPRIGVCVDTGHALRSGEDPVEWVKRLGPRVHDVHLKDVKGTTQFTEIGKGDLRTVDLFRTLHKQKYRGLVNLEYEEHEREVGPYVDECLSATRDAIAKAINRA